MPTKLPEAQYPLHPCNCIFRLRELKCFEIGDQVSAWYLGVYLGLMAHVSRKAFAKEICPCFPDFFITGDQPSYLAILSLPLFEDFE